MERIRSLVVTIFIRPFTLGAAIGLLVWTSGCFFPNIGLGEDSSPWWGTLLGAFLVAIYPTLQLYYGLTCNKRCAIVSICFFSVVSVVVCFAVIWTSDLNEIVARLLAPLIHTPIDSDASRLLASALLFGAITAVMSVAVDCYNTSNDVKSNYQRVYDLGFAMGVASKDPSSNEAGRTSIDNAYKALPLPVQEAIRSRVQPDDKK